METVELKIEICGDSVKATLDDVEIVFGNLWLHSHQKVGEVEVHKFTIDVGE